MLRSPEPRVLCARVTPGLASAAPPEGKNYDEDEDDHDDDDD